MSEPAPEIESIQKALDTLSSWKEPEATEPPESSPEPVEEVPEAPLPNPGALMAVTVRLPETFSMPGMRDLFIRAFTPQDGQDLPNAIDAILWCEKFCQDQLTAVIVAVEGIEPQFAFRGLAILEYTPGPWSMAPQCLHYHASGRDSIRALTDAIADWLVSIGQDRLVGLNFTGASDAAHGRLFSSRFTSEKLASLMSLSLKE